MASGYKAAPGKALFVVLILAVAAHLAAADDDDDKAYPWKCFRSCTKACHKDDDYAAATVMDGGGPTGNGSCSASVSGDCSSPVSGDVGECKGGCHDDACFKDVPAIGYPQCIRERRRSA
nr:unnamed protein product [Digitaria exilis]